MLMEPLFQVLILVVILILVPYAIWFVRVRPRRPQLEAQWNSDCEMITTAEIDRQKSLSVMCEIFLANDQRQR